MHSYIMVDESNMCANGVMANYAKFLVRSNTGFESPSWNFLGSSMFPIGKAVDYVDYGR